MDIYLVGGAVRDQLLGLPVQERDWVVVGATPDEMLKLNYKPVGKDFPVFLHPTTHEEYALARTERKIAKGYKGFNFYTSPEISLEEDLARRDLTINAIAQRPDGTLVDPYHGQQDLEAKILRHVSPAFQEDPVRILRLARFAAKFPEFKVHPDTLELMKSMVAAGEVDALVSERVWQECARALQENKPQRFFEVLAQVGALTILFPELRSLSALEKIKADHKDPVVNWALVLHELTPEAIKELCAHLRCPRDYSEFALLVAKYLANFRTLNATGAEGLLTLIGASDALRRPERFQQFVQACCLIEPKLIPHKDRLYKALDIIKNLDLSELQAQNLIGESFAKALYQKRLEALQKLL